MFTVTLSKGREKEKGRITHPLACQHSGRWHLFSRPYSLIDKLGTHLRHKTSIPVLGSKQWLNLQGQQEGLAGWRGLLGASQGSQRLTHPSKPDTLGERLEVTVMAATWGALAGLWPLPSLCADSPGPKTIHMRWRGHHKFEGQGHPLGDGQDNPKSMLLPQSSPPLLSLRSPFHSWLIIQRK